MSTTAVREKPIIFSGEMIRAILAGTKTQTRRVCKPQPVKVGHFWELYGAGWSDGITSVPAMPGHSLSTRCPYGAVGDRLWVRETWADTNGESGPMISYRAGGDRCLVEDAYPVEYDRYPNCQFTMWCGDLRRGEPGHAWRSPIHMPRWASRITLEISGVRVERLQDISKADAIAEGCSHYDCGHPDCGGQHYGPRGAFMELWDSINGKKYPWASSPWVWVLTFNVVRT